MSELRLQQIAHRKIWNGIVDTDSPARGILQAHQQIVRFAREQKLSRILIAEDDLHLSDMIHLNSLYEWIQERKAIADAGS